MPAQEEAILRYPDLEPFCLFGTAPPVELTTRFPRAEASRVDHMDDVFLAIDALFGEEALARHQVVYCYDPKRHQETLALLEGIRAQLTVPSHGPPTADGQALVEVNRRNLEATQRAILEALGSPGLAEEVPARVTAALNLQPTLEGHHLNLSTIKGTLASLRAEGLAGFRLERGRLLWERR